MSNPPQPIVPWVFLLLVLLLSLPFYGIGLTGRHLPVVSMLPLSALGAIVPMLAGLLLT